MSYKHQIVLRSHTHALFDYLIQQGPNGPSETDYAEEKHTHETPMPTK